MKKMLVIIFVLIVLTPVIILGILYLLAIPEREVQMKTFNDSGSRNVLVLYHPGLTAFDKDIADKYIEGLEPNNWHIDLTTYNSNTPTEIDEYDAVVLIGQTYWWSPNPAMSNYVTKVADFKEKPVDIIITAIGQGGRSTQLMKQAVEYANGTVNNVLTLYVLRPNDENDNRPNQEVAFEIAKKAGSQLSIDK